MSVSRWNTGVIISMMGRHVQWRAMPRSSGSDADITVSWLVAIRASASLHYFYTAHSSHVIGQILWIRHELVYHRNNYR